MRQCKKRGRPKYREGTGIADEILKFRERIGDFGTLLYAGHDWVDPALAKRSMELMATEVMPRLNKALDQQAAE